MKILHTVEFYDPSVGGAQEVVKQLSEQLVKLGHEVTVATTKLPHRKSKNINGVKIKEFSISGNKTFGITGEIKKYQKFVLKGKFDIILNYAAQQWATDSLFDILDKITAKKVFVPCGFSGLSVSQYSKYFEKMPVWMKQYDAIIFSSRNYQDHRFALFHKIKNLFFISNGASLSEFSNASLKNDSLKERLTIPKENKIILLVGSHSGAKGHQEAISIFKMALVKNTTFVIVADRNESFCQKKCEKEMEKFKHSAIRKFDKKQLLIKELSRKETVSLFFQSDLFFFPSNVECAPLVIYECLASKLPFLATDVGNIREIVLETKAGQLLPSKRAKKGLIKSRIFLSSIKLKKMLDNIDFWKKNSKKAYNIWKKKYEWSKLAIEYESLYEKLLKKV